MTKLIFITHPAVIIDPKTPIDQWSLSEKGRQEVEALGSENFWNSVDVIYSSSEPKATTVVGIVSKKRSIALPPDYKRDCLGEIRNRTFIEPSKFSVAVGEWYAHLTENPNGWESVADAQKRIVECVTSLMTKNKGKTVVMVGHGGTGTLLLCQIKGATPSFDDDPLTTGCIAVYDWDNQKIISPWKKY